MVATTSKAPLSPVELSGVEEVADEVVLLDAAHRPVGTAPRTTVHGTGTPLHLAFSCYVGDGDGRVGGARSSCSSRPRARCACPGRGG